jgi:hypothetical protein
MSGIEQVSTSHRSPNSLANLDRGRVLWGDQRKCAKCRRPAKRGSAWCPGHDGRARSGTVFRAGRADSVTLIQMAKRGLLPGDLLASAAWRNLTGLATSVRAPLRLQLVLLWAERDRQPLAFARAWRQAIAAGTGDKRRQSAWLADA